MFNPYDSRLLTDTDADHRARKPPSLGGDDYAYGKGSPIRSPGPGVVDLVDRDPGGSGGRMVGVRHAGGVRSEQLHALSISVEVGQAVDEGEFLGWSGASAYGSETGTGGYHIHAHFVVNGRRWGWENYLASVGATPAAITITPITDKEVEALMAFKDVLTIYTAPARGYLVVGPGFTREIIGNERLSILRDDLKLTTETVPARTWDVIAEFFRGSDQVALTISGVKSV